MATKINSDNSSIALRNWIKLWIMLEISNREARKIWSGVLRAGRRPTVSKLRRNRPNNPVRLSYKHQANRTKLTWKYRTQTQVRVRHQTTLHRQAWRCRTINCDEILKTVLQQSNQSKKVTHKPKIWIRPSSLKNHSCTPSMIWAPRFSQEMSKLRLSIMVLVSIQKEWPWAQHSSIYA